MSRRNVDSHLGVVETTGALHASGKIHEWLDSHDAKKCDDRSRSLEPVHFAIAKSVGRTVVPFAHINHDGFLTGESFYLVYSASRKQPYYASQTRTALHEAHALAERTALTRGIFTHNGREHSETLIAEGIPRQFRGFYVHERLGYLAVLQHDVEHSDELNRAERATLEQTLNRTIEELPKTLPRP